MSPEIIAVIPCRRGSKRLEGKNWRDFCGKPLFCWSVDVAHECNIVDKVIISTNDPEVGKIYEERYLEYGKILLHKRPEEFAKDDSSMESVIHNLFEHVNENATLILLQPTSPLREIQDLLNVYTLFKRSGGLSVISVFREDPLHFKLNGSIYMISYPRLKYSNTLSGGKNVSLYVMPREKSWDIDTEVDFHRAEVEMKKRIGKLEQFYEDE